MDAYLLGLRAPLFEGATGEAVRYVPRIAGSPVEGLRVVRSTDDAEGLGDAGRSRRLVRFEIRFGTLVRAPQRGDAIEADDGLWRVIHADTRADLGSWIVNVEAGREAASDG